MSPTFAVVQFAQQEVVDHTSLDNQLTSIAQAEGLPVPAALTSPAVQSAIATELNLFGPASDPEYLLDVIRGHRQDVSSYQQEMAVGQDPQLRSFAQAALPTLEGISARPRHSSTSEISACCNGWAASEGSGRVSP